MKLGRPDDHIEITPGVCGGEPRIRGRRITVAHIAAWHLTLGMPVDEIAEEFDLDRASIHSALAFYYDHRQAIDDRTEQDRLFVEQLRSKTPSILAEKLESLARQARGTSVVKQKRAPRNKLRKSNASSR